MNQQVLAKDRVYSLIRSVGVPDSLNARQLVIFQGLGVDFRKAVLNERSNKFSLARYTLVSASFYETVWAAPSNVLVIVAVSNALIGGQPVFLSGSWARK